MDYSDEINIKALFALGALPTGGGSTEELGQK